MFVAVAIIQNTQAMGSQATAIHAQSHRSVAPNNMDVGPYTLWGQMLCKRDFLASSRETGHRIIEHFEQKSVTF